MLLKLWYGYYRGRMNGRDLEGRAWCTTIQTLGYICKALLHRQRAESFQK